MARSFGIASLAEARAYLAHPLLGTRLRECVAILASLPGADARGSWATRMTSSYAPA